MNSRNARVTAAFFRGFSAHAEGVIQQVLVKGKVGAHVWLQGWGLTQHGMDACR